MTKMQFYNIPLVIELVNSVTRETKSKQEWLLEIANGTCVLDELIDSLDWA